MKKILSALRHHPYWTGIGAIIVIGAISYGLVANHRSHEVITTPAVRGTVSEEVSVTGRVVSAQNLDLSFEKTVKVSQVLVRAGDKVTAGETLIVSDNGDSSAAVSEANAQYQSALALEKQEEANLLSEQVKLEELKRGPRPEETLIAESKVTSATQAEANAVQALENQIRQAYTSADDAIHNEVDQFISNPTGPYPELVFSVSSPGLEGSIEKERVNLEYVLLDWNKKIAMPIDETNLDTMASLSTTNLNEVSAFLNQVAEAVNSIKADNQNSNLTPAIVDGYKTDASAARTEVNNASSGLIAAVSSVQSAKSAVDLAKREYDLTQAGSSDEDIAAQGAAVARAEADVASQNAQAAVALANLQSAQAQYGKTVITSPVDAIVATLPAKAGESIDANEKAISLISEAAYQVETNVPESDVAKLAVGNAATVTLDAYGPDVQFAAEVISVDPGETIDDGVASYKTRLQFTQNDDRIRSGMTANVLIVGEKHEGVIKIPSRAVFTKDDQKVVTVKTGERLDDVPVTVGLKGSDGSVEITDGLHEGDVVVTDTPQ